MRAISSAPRVLGVLTAAVMLLLAAATTSAAQQQDEDEYLGLPDDEGREEVVAYCGACHSLRLVVQQRLPRYRWEELMVWMTEKQGMPKLPADEEKLVIDYLAEHLGPPPRRRRF